jgi:hypothetical protein
MTGDMGFDFREGPKFLSPSLSPYQLCGPRASSPVGKESFFPGDKSSPDVKLTIRTHLILRLIIYGTIPPLPHTPSWCSIWFTTGMTIAFTLALNPFSATANLLLYCIIPPVLQLTHVWMSVEFEILKSIIGKNSVLWNVTSFSLVKFYRPCGKNIDGRFGGPKSKPSNRTNSKSAEAVHSSETSVNFYLTTRHYVLDHGRYSSGSNEIYTKRFERLSVQLSL